MAIYKNTAKIIGFSLRNTDGTPNTTATPSVKVASASGNFAAATNSAVRRTDGGSATNAFYLTLTSSEMNSDLVEVKITATGCVDVDIRLYTESDYTYARAGYLDSLNGLVASIWNAFTSGMTTAGSIGKRLVDNLTGDAFARLGAPAGASVSADVAAVKSDTNIALARLTSARAANLDNLSVAPPTAAQIRADLDASSTRLANLDQTVSSRASAANLAVVATYLDTEINEIRIVVNKLDQMIEVDGSDYRFDANALEQAPSGGALTVEEILDFPNAIETGMTLRQAIRLQTSVMGGILSGVGTPQRVFKNAVQNTKARVTCNLDLVGNRTSIVYDLD